MKPEYNPSNYRKIPPFPLLSDFNPITHIFSSNLLLIKWVGSGNNEELSGIIRVVRVTPVGELEPLDYPLKIYTQKKQYIRLVSVSNDGNEYKIEVIQPKFLKSTLSISEFMPPTYSLDDSTSANDAAMQASLTAIQTSSAAQLTALNTVVSQTNEGRPSTLASSNVSVSATTVSTVVTKSEKNRGVMITNTGLQNVKFWIQDTALTPVPVYATDLNFEMELRPNSVWEVPPELVRSNIYALAKAATSTLAVTLSAYV